MSHRLTFKRFEEELTSFFKSGAKLRLTTNPEINRNHPDFFDFLNRQQVTISLNLEKREELLRALVEPNWDAPIFKDKDLPYYLIALFKTKQITRNQCIAVLDRYKILTEFDHRGTYPILDASGDLTSEAQAFLIPVLNRHHSDFKKLEGDALKEFINFIAKLPKSEQFFYMTDVGHVKEIGEIKIADVKEDPRRLEHVLEALGALHIDRRTILISGNYILHLPIGVVNALNCARFGKRHHVPVRGRLGRRSIREVEQDRDAFVWPRDVAFPGTVSDEIHTKKVHEFSPTYTADSAHNDHHANVLASLPMPIRVALYFLAGITRSNFKSALAPIAENEEFMAPFIALVQNTKLDLVHDEDEFHKLFQFTSKEIWEWVACDFRYFIRHRGKIADLDNLYSENPDPKKLTKAFCEMLNEGNKTDFMLSNGVLTLFSQGGYLAYKNAPTPVGIAMILSMIQDKKIWTNIGIDPDHLISPFKEIYEGLKENYISVKDKESKKLTIFNCLMLIALKKAGLEREFEYIKKRIKQNKDKIIFVKYKGDESLTLRKNRIYLQFQGRIIASEKDLLELVKDLSSVKITSKDEESSSRIRYFNFSNHIDNYKEFSNFESISLNL